MVSHAHHASRRFLENEVPRPEPGPNEALIRVAITTICGTDVHILKGEYPVRSGPVVGHEAVGIVEQLGAGVTGYAPSGTQLVPDVFGRCAGQLVVLENVSRCSRGGARYLADVWWDSPGFLVGGADRPQVPANYKSCGKHRAECVSIYRTCVSF
jgi:threonine dehydrogenase-like Zn-dependent dehydrogenase